MSAGRTDRGFPRVLKYTHARITASAVCSAPLKKTDLSFDFCPPLFFPFLPFPLFFFFFSPKKHDEQIRFHEHHPEYGDYWSPDTGNDTDTTPTTYDKPNSERLPQQDASDEPRTLQVRGARGGWGRRG